MTANDYDAWLEGRRRKVTGPQGNLALIETRWGADDPEAALQDQPSTVTATVLSRVDLLSGLKQTGVRLWDANSPAGQHFVETVRYAYDPAWVLEARWSDAPSDERRVPFEHGRDEGRTRDLPVPGDLHLTLAGQDYTLHAFDDDGTLLLVFGDPTNGKETYGSGRFLFVERAPGTDRVVLDFNQAFVPPCGFSAHFNCPVPPPQNRLAVPVEAGEKLPVFRDGFTI
ncbi:MAG TPA: DUF1684 domain-containing protein [Actinoplanes sp.]|nr:DUF1684 domain-containing protein [Actinoplanes sp.]